MTPRKFATLSIERQHKECALTLRALYQSPTVELKADYILYCTWLKISPQPIDSPEALSNAYHFHLRAAKISLNEPHFLPLINRGDRNEAHPSLGYSIYLDNLRSAHNVGSILRTTEAFQIGSVHFSEQTPWITQKKVQDSSMGAYQWISCQKSLLKDLPKPLIALETAPTAQSIYDFTFPKNCTIALGNEEYGCSEETLEQADLLLHIPLRGRKNSLNVANAFAICASEIARQATIQLSRT